MKFDKGEITFWNISICSKYRQLCRHLLPLEWSFAVKMSFSLLLDEIEFMKYCLDPAMKSPCLTFFPTTPSMSQLIINCASSFSRKSFFPSRVYLTLWGGKRKSWRRCSWGAEDNWRCSLLPLDRRSTWVDWKMIPIPQLERPIPFFIISIPSESHHNAGYKITFFSFRQ